MLLYGGLCWQVKVCECFSWHGQFFCILGRPTRLVKWKAYHGSGHHSAMCTDFLFDLRRKSRLGMKTLGFRLWTLYGLRIKFQQRKLSRVLRDVCFLHVSWSCLRWWHVSFQMAGKAWRPSQPRSQTFQIFSDPFGSCLLSLPHSSHGWFLSLDLMWRVSCPFVFFDALRLEMKLSLTKLRSFEVTYLQSNVTWLQIFGFVSMSFPFQLFNFIVSLASSCFRPSVDRMTFACLCLTFCNAVRCLTSLLLKLAILILACVCGSTGMLTWRCDAATLIFCPGILSWLDKWHLLLSHGRHHSARSEPKGWESGCGSCGTGNIMNCASGGLLGIFKKKQTNLHAAWFSEPLFTTQAPQVLALDSAPVEVSGGSQVQKMSSRSCK